MAEPGRLMASEIAEQPAVFDRLLSDGRADIAAVAKRVAERGPRFVLLAARGTSDHAALYAKYLVEVRMGLPAGLVSLSTLTLYGARPDLRDVLFVAISQSGASPDLVDSTALARRGGALTVAVTNEPESRLAAVAELTVDLMAGPERAVAATKTYTAELLASYLLVESVLGRPTTEAARLPELAERTLGIDVDAVASRYRFADRLVTTARGYCYPTAREAALKLMETCYISAQAFSGADLLHGPLAMIDQVVPVIAVVPDGPGGRAMAPVVDRLRERSSDPLVVGADAAAVPGGAVLAVPEVAEELSPLLTVLPLQRLAWRVALDRGSDPDRPRAITKVTETY